MKGGHGFKIAVRMNNLRRGDWGEIQNNAVFEVCTRNQDLRMFGFYTQQNVNSVANYVFISKTGLPRVVVVLRWVSFVFGCFYVFDIANTEIQT